MFDANDQLLYVGISNYPITRLETHRRSSPWRSEIASHTVEEFPTRREAAFAESEAINIENPLYNKQGRRAEPKSVTMAKRREADAAKAAARRSLTRRLKSARLAEGRLRLAVVEGRQAGLTIPEVAKLSGLSGDEVRRISRAYGNSRTQAEREEAE
ncbi:MULTISPECIES: hypothetical protein [unclassified Streptomyces]|uniref:hypothetical protein n=1 Tax=unclassified Streptomyces TaxID=2593676 RepID=UPI0033175DE6